MLIGFVHVKQFTFKRCNVHSWDWTGLGWHLKRLQHAYIWKATSPKKEHDMHGMENIFGKVTQQHVDDCWLSSGWWVVFPCWWSQREGREIFDLGKDFEGRKHAGLRGNKNDFQHMEEKNDRLVEELVSLSGKIQQAF